VLVELAGDACAFVEAKHAEGAGELVGNGCGIVEQRRGKGSGDGGGGRAIQQGEAVEDLRLIAQPEGSDQFLLGRLGQSVG